MKNRDEIIEVLKEVLNDPEAEFTKITTSADSAHDEENLLVVDGNTSISLVRDVGQEGCFGFCISDPSGFIGVYFSIEQWHKMRDKVDTF